jgi:hypothetical protein
MKMHALPLPAGRLFDEKIDAHVHCPRTSWPKPPSESDVAPRAKLPVGQGRTVGFQLASMAKSERTPEQSAALPP